MNCIPSFGTGCLGDLKKDMISGTWHSCVYSFTVLDSLHNVRPHAMFLGNEDEQEKSFPSTCSRMFWGDRQGKQV